MKDIIIKRRKELGLTQLELAKILNVSDKVISKWETGRSLPDTSMIMPLCDALKISVDELFQCKAKEDEYSKISQNELNVKYKNLSIFSISYLLVIALLVLVGRYCIDKANYHANYEKYQNVGIFIIVTSIILFIVGIGIVLIIRNNINGNTSDISVDRTYIKRMLIALFIAFILVGYIFIAYHGLSDFEQLMVLGILILIDASVCGLLLFWNKKRK